MNDLTFGFIDLKHLNEAICVVFVVMFKDYYKQVDITISKNQALQILYLV